MMELTIFRSRPRVRKLFLLGITVALLLIIFFFLTFEGTAKTIIVDDDGGEDYEKIQWAIENATAGDTVRVYEGTYQEMIVIDIQINLTGSGAANTTIEAPEKGDVILVKADWVNVSKFKVIGKGRDSASADIKVEGNHTQIFRNNCTENDYGIRLVGNHGIISNNSCKENIVDGIWISLCEKSVVTNNECDQNGYCGIRASASERSIISNNSCENNSNGIVFSSGSKNGRISGNSCSNNTNGIRFGTSDLNLVNNNHCFLNENGITLWLNSYSNTLENNRIMDNHNGTLIDAGSHQNEIRNCVLSGNEIGILLKDNCMENTANSNRFEDNSRYGINALNNNGYTIDATDNWWGHTSGPNHYQNNSEGQGDEVTDYVLFDPWIRQTQSIHNINKGTSYLLIQDALDDANEGDTIRVYEGTYRENLTINKTLSLQGNTSALTVIDGGGSGDLLTIEAGANWCNVSGFNFTGTGPGNNDMNLHSSYNHIFENRFESDNAKGISLATYSHHNIISNNIVANKSYGIHVPSSYNSISNNSLSNCYGAVFCNNPGARYNFILSNSVDYNSHAIWLRNGASRNTVSYNTCLNNGYGIMIQDSDSNTLSRAQSSFPVI